MTDLQLFNFDASDVRIVMLDGVPWFVLNDVCAAIGIEAPRRAVTRLDSDDVRSTHVTDALGRQQETTVVNESGLYDLIFVSRKPQAKRFKKWITSEVIPSIRQTGMYAMDIDLPTALERYAAALREKDAASKRAIEAQTRLDELRPIEAEWRTYMDSTGMVSLGALAQALGGGRQRLIERLRELEILVSLGASQGGVRPMQQYKERGWFVIRTEQTNIGPKLVAYATPKGVSMVFRALIQHGIGDRKWDELPKEEELFNRLEFQPDPEG